jgi:hypothetical protein
MKRPIPGKQLRKSDVNLSDAQKGFPELTSKTRGSAVLQAGVL